MLVVALEKTGDSPRDWDVRVKSSTQLLELKKTVDQMRLLPFFVVPIKKAYISWDIVPNRTAPL